MSLSPELLLSAGAHPVVCCLKRRNTHKEPLLFTVLVLPLRILPPLTSLYSMAPSGFCLLLSSRPVLRGARQCCHALSPRSSRLAAFTHQHTCVAGHAAFPWLLGYCLASLPPSSLATPQSPWLSSLLTSQPPSLPAWGAPEFSPGVLLLRVPVFRRRSPPPHWCIPVCYRGLEVLLGASLPC